jgi:hypothetical protein
MTEDRWQESRFNFTENYGNLFVFGAIESLVQIVVQIDFKNPSSWIIAVIQMT